MKIFTIYIFCFLFISCSQTSKETNHELTDFDKDSIKTQNAINTAKQKYPNITNWGEIKVKYSIGYDSFLNKNQYIEDGHINDIYRKDSIEYVRIYSNAEHDFYIDLSITKEQEKMLTANEDDEFVYVVNIYAIKKAEASLEIETDEDESAETGTDDDNTTAPIETTNVDISGSDIFIGKGKLIDLILKK